MENAPDLSDFRKSIRQKAGLLVLLLGLFKTGAAQTVSQAEYFFDVDPGAGNGASISVAAADPLTFTSTISTTGLAAGYHNLFIRTRSSDALWSLYEPRQFFIQQSIIAAEYFFDSDPGPGLATPITITPTLDQLTFSSTILTTGLSPGYHFLFLRTQDEHKKWAIHQPQGFYVTVYLLKAEYFIDTDPGVGNGIPLAISSPLDLINLTPTITPGVLPDGIHYLFVRTRDASGFWSCFEPQSFQVDSSLPIGLTQFDAVATEDNQVRLNWTTESEHNNDFFTIEHAGEGMEFTEIIKTRGAGNSNHVLHYESVHTNPSDGINYYRLKQTDFDGHSTFSKTEAVQVVRNKLGALIYPNPVTTEWFVDFSQGDANVDRRIELYDLMGRKQAEFNSGDQAIVKLDRDGLSRGTYLLRITSVDGSFMVRKVIFQ